jgi:hypothetical protein
LAEPGDLGATRVGAAAESVTFGDFRESVDIVGWNSSLEQGLGLAGRVSNVGLGTTDGYFLHYNTDPGFPQSGLVIDRIDKKIRP